MKLRSCDSTHFIRTIRAGLEIKVCNIQAHGRPSLKFKKLEDVYDQENERRSFADGIFDNEAGKRESKFFPMADRLLWEQKPEINQFGLADDCMDGDLDGHVTLSHLKKLILTKKRKVYCCDKSSNRNVTDGQTSADESDLHEPLVKLKINRSKISASKRRRLNPTNASPSTRAIGVKCEADSVSEGSPWAGELVPIVRVEVEIQYSECSGQENQKSDNDDSSIGIHELEIQDSELSEQENQKPYNEDSNVEIHNLDDVALSEYRDLLSCGPTRDTFASVEGSSDQFGYPEPIEVLLPFGENSFSSNSSDLCSYVYPEFPPLAPAVYAHDYESSFFSSLPEDSQPEVRIIEKSTNTIEMPEQTSNTDDTAIDNRNMESVFSANTIKRICWYTEGIASSKNENSMLTDEDTVVNQEPPSLSSDFTEDNSIYTDCHFEGELAAAEERHTSMSPSIDTTSTSSSENLTFDHSETYHPPRRIPSTRKAISPSSQERLCTAMNSILVHDSDNQFKAKQKLFVKDTGSTVRSNSEHDKITANDEEFRSVTQQKIIFRKRAIAVKPNGAKYNLEGPRLSRALRNFSSGDSIQGCSRSAITFSQRQMQDMESLALKLMNELKSMKDIVEQKLLIEAYRSPSLKNDVSEVKSAINNATKAEESARKWLSIMARDCNRFCKIMEMTPRSADATKGNPTREKKISFADEAGEKLCHVRFFEDGEALNASYDVQQ